MDAKWTTLIVAGLIITSSFAAEKRGGLVLQFDDGWTSWATVIAPEVQKVGGVASCFVNNQNIRSGRITRDDLLTLQNTYHWEIGTHTWHHLNAPSYIRKNGMDAWMDQELMKSIRELRGMGLDIRSLVFPFNAYTPELGKAVQPLVESYRHDELFALAPKINANKTIPGTGIDMAHYIPPALLMKWIDLAAQNDSFLFLYGHRILPDTSFATGTVVSVTATSLTAELPVPLPGGTDLILVPDITRRQVTTDYFRIQSVDGKTIQVDRADLSANTKPGAQFLVGEAYSTRLSDFRAMLEYAAARINFYT